MSLAMKTIDPAYTDIVKAELRGFNVKTRGENAARNIASCILALNILGIGDRLMVSTVENVSDPKTADIEDLRVFIKAVLYRLMVQDGQYERGGKFYHAPSPSKKPQRQSQAAAA